MYNIYYNNASHNGFASYPGSVPNSGHQLDQRAPATSTDISHTHPPARSCFSCSRVLLESRFHRLSPWITALSLLPLLSFSFAFEWRAIELLRSDKRETQFKLRLLAVVTTVIMLAFHGNSRAHVHTTDAPICRIMFEVHETVFFIRNFYC